MGLPVLRELIRDLLRNKLLFQLDARSYFFQFLLGSDTSDVVERFGQ